MLLIGIVGGVASGKSVVAEKMRDFGGIVLDADGSGHEVLRQPDVIAALGQRWGKGVLAQDGSISRAAVAKIVFAPDGLTEKKFLEALTHPRIERLLREQIAAAEALGDVPAAILDAALLFEAGWDRLCDYLVFVSAPREQRLARALARGWSQSEFLARESSQLPLDEKRSRCGFVIDNSHDLDSTRQQVGEFWRLNVRKTDH